MTRKLSAERVRNLLRDLQAATARRSEAEAESKSAYESATASLRRTFETTRDAIQKKREGDVAAETASFQSQRQQFASEADSLLKAAKARYGKARDACIEKAARDQESTQQTCQETVWAQDAMLEARTKKAGNLRQQFDRKFADAEQKIEALREQSVERLKAWSVVPAGIDGGSSPSLPALDQLPAALEAKVQEAQSCFDRLNGLIAPRLLAGDRWLLIVFVLWILLALSGFVLSPWYLGPIIATAASLLAGLGLRFGLAARTRSQGLKETSPLFQALAEAERLKNYGKDQAENQQRTEIADAQRTQKEEVRRAEKLQRDQLAATAKLREDTISRLDAELAEQTASITGQRELDLHTLESAHRSKLIAIQSQADQQLQAATADFEREQAAIEQKRAQSFEELARTWNEAVQRDSDDLKEIQAENSRLFPNWSGPEWSEWQPPALVPAGMRFGGMAVDVSRFLGGQPEDSRLPHFQPEKFQLPALLPFPEKSSTVLIADGAGRQSAVHALQAMMLRFLTSVPPGKVRFTVVDPVALGENFASFMHLADHDEQLIGSRIWTETAHIEKRLSDLTAHMENVIQKYLRNQYASIEEYNAQAGEVAEPYRVLVVANFPVNFSLEACRRLVSIASSGASCGVYALVSVDTKQPMPQGFSLADLEAACLKLTWQGSTFRWEDSDFGPQALTMDAPPDAGVIAKAVQVVGSKAKDASRVEVDFSFIAPPDDRWWIGDSRRGISVPLGRAGATKRQLLELGKGTSQHALIAGKTGSGKSTLLHALITNLALHYSPDEVELYLIDFKKGVEFKTYATHHLPHARVIAVESEREFGLSVLQRLDAELKRRGDLFRTAGVQDVAGYRDKLGKDALRMPRILLVVDEFQEFFVEEDKIAQETSLLLDRLVRQGRAFGLHVLLGSQTLGGAYSLARSTIDQMAVRIALQCSEADANLILSKDNNAARLLSRPGEAIYNDANGLLEGNDIFQVVWLAEERREDYLEKLNLRAGSQSWSPESPPIIFEGNFPADLDKNPLLKRLRDQGPKPSRDRVAWLGDALAIKDPTAAVFRRQSGSHLLLVGQQGDAARGVLVAAAVALHAQHVPQENTGGLPPITIVDASPADDPQADCFATLARNLGPGVRTVGSRDVPEVLTQLSTELARRQKEPDAPAAPLFTIVYGLHRLRDLRKAEDDFGFGRRREEKKISPSEAFQELIREGPALGMHVIVWVDSLANTQRALDRSGMREFEQRVLFQMSVTDSSTLIDTPAASRLGVNRALFACEELTTPEKFRPYRLPPESWLREFFRE